MDATEWDESVGRFRAHLEREDKSPLTVRNYLRELRAFAEWYRARYGDPPELADLAEDDVRSYRDHLEERKLKPATRNLARSAIQSLVKWAHSERIIREPVRMPKMARQSQRAPRWLTAAEERRLLKAVRKAGNPHHLAMVELFLVFGLRISEAAGLTWGDVAMRRAKAELRVMGKGRKERVLPFLGIERARSALKALGWEEHRSERARPLLWGQRGPLSASGIKQLMASYGAAAGLDPFSAHMLRHTCAHRMLEGKEPKPLPYISRWMGHESLNTTLLYTLPSEEELAAAAGGRAEGWETWDDD